MGLGFVNIENELSFQEKYGIPDINFAPEIALKNRPLDFQYDSDEAISSFLAIKIDINYTAIDSINLSTSLINSTGTKHICNGLTDYAADLECGLYYFLVNSKYQSETFEVFTGLIEGTSNQEPIAVSGLEFINTDYENPFRLKEGAPDINLGKQYTSSTNILPFIYKSSEAVSSFSLIELDNLGNEINTTSLSTSLISSDGSYHTSTQGSYSFAGGRYFFRVNSKYESDIFCVVELENVVSNALLLETGDYLLLETGFKLLLE